MGAVVVQVIVAVCRLCTNKSVLCAVHPGNEYVRWIGPSKTKCWVSSYLGDGRRLGGFVNHVSR